MRLINLINLPPVWLVAFMALAWLLRDGAPLAWPGRGLIGLGLGLMVWAAIGFLRARTSIIPRERPSALVATGPYRFTRNPIYLADLIILVGWCLAIGAYWALLLVPVLAVVLERLFIRPEEALLRADLGAPYAAYCKQVRRWI